MLWLKYPINHNLLLESINEQLMNLSLIILGAILENKYSNNISINP